MHFLPLHAEETYVSLWHIIDFENPMASTLKLKKLSKKTSPSYRSKPGAEANQLIVSVSSKLLYFQGDIRNHYRAAKQRLKETPNPRTKHQYKGNTLGDGPVNPRAGNVDL